MRSILTMTNKQFLTRLILLAQVPAVIFFITSFVVDPEKLNGIFDVGVSSPSKSRLHRIYAMDQASPEYILIGGSRVLRMDSSQLSKYLGGDVYNASLFSLTVYEQKRILERQILSGKLKKVIFGVNFYAFSDAIDNIKYDFTDNYFKYPLVFSIFKRYISLSSFRQSIKALKRKNLSMPDLNKETSVVLSDINSKNKSRDKSDNKITSVVLPDINSTNKSWDKSYNKITTIYRERYNEYNLSVIKLAYFKELLQSLEASGVEYKVFITPVHSSLYKEIPIKKLTEWKFELSKITAFYDFMYKHPLNGDSDNFDDPAHFNASLGNRIFDRMYAEKKVQNYGVYMPKYAE